MVQDEGIHHIDCDLVVFQSGPQRALNRLHAVDGRNAGAHAMRCLDRLRERGRKARLKREVRSAKTEEAALACIGAEVDQRLELLTTDDERKQIHCWVLEILRRDDADDPHLRLEDVLGGAAVAVIILLATLPVIAPFLIVANPNTAVRISNWIALTELFAVGLWWGRVVGARPLRLATGLTLVGVVMVVVTILLGG